jgi:hypothetical protein
MEGRTTMEDVATLVLVVSWVLGHAVWLLSGLVAVGVALYFIFR